MSHAISPFSSKIDRPSHFFQKGLDLEKCAQRQLPSNLYNLSLIKGEIFPFQSTMEYVPKWDRAPMQKQFAAIYNRCVNNSIPMSCAMFSNALKDYNIDLTNKDISIGQRKLLKVECRMYDDKIMRIVFYFMRLNAIAYAPPLSS